MRITMKTLYATPEFTAQPGETIDVSRKAAKQLIERRYAVAADDDPADDETRETKKSPKKAGKKSTAKATEGDAADDTEPNPDATTDTEPNPDATTDTSDGRDV